MQEVGRGPAVPCQPCSGTCSPQAATPRRGRVWGWPSSVPLGGSWCQGELQLGAHSSVGLLQEVGKGWALPKHPPVPQGGPQLPSPARVPRGERVPARYPQPCSDLMSPPGSVWGTRGCWGIGRGVVLQAGITAFLIITPGLLFCASGQPFEVQHRASGRWGRTGLGETLWGDGTSPSCAGTISCVPSCPEAAGELLWLEERVSH